MKDFIFKVDTKISSYMHKLYLEFGQVANTFMEIISYLAHIGLLFLIFGVGLSVFKRTRRLGFTIIGAVGIGFILTNVVLKNIISRARPFDTNSQFMLWWIDAGAVKETGFSFPSGHVAATTAFAVAIFLLVRKKHSWPILFFPVIMTASRIYLMVHFFSDCIGGIVVGSISAVASFFIVKWIYKSKLKLFVWLKNFEIFKERKPAPQPKVNNVQGQNKPETDYEYLTQKEEDETKTRLIEDEINRNAKTEEDNKK